MVILKVHLSEWVYGDSTAQSQWRREGLINGKVKFCDGLMLKKGRVFDFSELASGVDCKKCLKKIDSWSKNGFDLPYAG